MNPAFLEMVKPWLAQATRDALRMVGMYLLSKQVIQGGDAGVAAFVGAGMTLAGFGWGWFTTVGMVKLQAFAKRVTTPAVVPPAPTSVTPTIVKILLIAFLPLVLLAATSKTEAAQLRAPEPAATPALTEKCLIPWDPLKLCGALTGKPEEDMQRVVKRIQGVGRDDMNYAMLKAKTANTNASKVRLQCLQSIMDAKDAAEGVAIKDDKGNLVQRPDPAVVTAIEDVAELVDALAPGGPLITGCAGAAQLLKLNTIQAINGIVTGAAAIAAAPVGL